jgi:hypothetical protein
VAHSGEPLRVRPGRRQHSPSAPLNEYLACHSRQISTYFKRKLRTLPKLRIEFRSSIEGLEPQLNRLIASTLAQSSVDYVADIRWVDLFKAGEVAPISIPAVAPPHTTPSSS